MTHTGIRHVESWFEQLDWLPMDFQKETWEAYAKGYSGVVNAPTGSGKTYSVLLAVLADYIENHKKDAFTAKPNQLKLIWITPIKALAKEILISSEKALQALGLPWNAEIRTGDSTAKDRATQFKSPPEILITTPESLHVILTTKGYKNFLATVSCIVADEWHELIGSKRGVQTELLISAILSLNPNGRIWGISATIGNLDEAIDVLLFPISEDKRIVIKSSIQKKITLRSVIPEEIEKFPWAGHLGLKLAHHVIDILKESKTILIFTNTRAQCEIWYHRLLELDPDLAGQLAMHHGSISREIRDWVEDALYEGRIKAVVCTSSLDLGVDFRPVETIIQVGSPKGVARFVQRAGRSGHQPGAESHIWFVPTHALELIEAAGLRMAITHVEPEERIPYIRSFDVLLQYLMTLAVSEGFYPQAVLLQIKNTHCFSSIDDMEWLKMINFLQYGGDTLQAYDEYKKIEIADDGRYLVTDKKKILRHKLSIGTIVSEALISVKLMKGGHLGVVEESFMSQLNPGDAFWFAGRSLELVTIREMTARVKPSTAKSGKIPSYAGGRMPLSSQMSKVLREKIYQYTEGDITDPEIEALIPLFEMQALRSVIPKRDEFLIEYFQSNEGYHLVMYPFEGRNVHEGMAALIAKRISMQQSITFSIAMNDLGFELLSDQKIDVESLLNKSLFTTQNLTSDIQAGINSVEMTKRKFRDIARISGMIFSGFPGKQKKERHIQASSQLIYEVFREYEPENLLYLQAFDEVMTFQLEETRMRQALMRITDTHFIISQPDKATPFSFPIIADRMRENLTSEKLEDRIRKMTKELEK